MNSPIKPSRSLLGSLIQWIDTDYSVEPPEVIRAMPDGVNWVRCIPFVILHAGCLGVIWTGWSWFAVWSAVALYFIRMFAVTGIFHRYFSHKTYSTSRFGQFLLALWTGTTVQRGRGDLEIAAEQEEAGVEEHRHDDVDAVQLVELGAFGATLERAVSSAAIAPARVSHALRPPEPFSSRRGPAMPVLR